MLRINSKRDGLLVILFSAGLGLINILSPNMLEKLVGLSAKYQKFIC